MMRQRILRLARVVHALYFAVIALTVPLASEAASLGALEVRSALGEPLVASAPVLFVEPGEHITAAVGSAQAYLDAGLPYDASLTGTRVDVAKGRDGGPILQIRGTAASADPVVQLLLEVRLPKGVLAGHYTVLLDPPGAALAKAVPPESVTFNPLKPSAVVAESREPLAQDVASGPAPAQPTPRELPTPPPERVDVPTPTPELVDLPRPKPAPESKPEPVTAEPVAAIVTPPVAKPEPAPIEAPPAPVVQVSPTPEPAPATTPVPLSDKPPPEKAVAAAPKPAATPAEQKPQPSLLRPYGSIPPRAAGRATARSESSALMEAEPLMHVRNSQVQGCGLRLTGGEPGKQASSWFDVSFNVFRRGLGLAQSIAYEIRRSDYEGDSRPEKVPVQSTWVQVSGGSTRIGENIERRDTLVYSLVADDVLALFEAVANGDPVTLGIRRWGQRVDAVYTGAPFLSNDSRHQMSACLADLALG